MPIRILPPILVNQIAAGVDGVERSSSVVKASRFRKIKSQE